MPDCEKLALFSSADAGSPKRDTSQEKQITAKQTNIQTKPRDTGVWGFQLIVLLNHSLVKLPVIETYFGPDIFASAESQ